MITALLIDDEASIRNGLIKHIHWKQLGIDNITALDSAEKAIAFLEENHPDLIISDIRLPRMDGIQLAWLIREKNKNSHIIFISAYSDLEYYRNAIKLKVEDYIEKPINLEKMEETILKVTKKILSEDIRSVLFGMEEDQLKRLAVDLHEYKHLAAFGISYSESAAINLQHKMHYYHKFLYTTMNDRQQENYIESADEETLIFIFSNSGKYITEYQNREGRPPKYSFDKTKAKIVLVTSNEQMLVDKRVDECVLFRYADCVQNHPILYQVFIERLLYSYEELYGASEGMNTK